MKKPLVIDRYFPTWLEEVVAKEVEDIPVQYNNSPYQDFAKARFFGNMLMMHNEKPQHLKQWWFIDYFNHCMYHDVLEQHHNYCTRILLNLQLPNQDGVTHTDSNDKHFTTVIYMACGNSGDLIVGDDTIEFKQGRLVSFNSNIPHKARAPAEGHRITLGAVYPLINNSNETSKSPKKRPRSTTFIQ